MPGLTDGSFEEINDLHNKNCFDYLKKLLGSNNNGQFEFAGTQYNFSQYDDNVSYANVYSSLLSAIENDLAGPNKHSLLDKLKNDHDFQNFIISIYENDNDVLKQTYNVIKKEITEHRVSDPELQRVLKDSVKPLDHSDKHTYTPKGAESKYSRFMSLVGSDFKPMLTTSIPTVVKFNYTEANQSPIKQLRFGTQAQRSNGTVRNAPLFEAYLTAKQYKNSSPDGVKEKTYDHVYFNLLGLDRHDFQGKKEKQLTEQLHLLENEHTNIAVITLPADEALMEKSAYLKTKITEDAQTTQQIFDEFRQICLGTSNLACKDFKMSDQVRKDANLDLSHINELLSNAFHEMGTHDPNAKLSGAEKQALWFHITKYTLPNHILTTLQPDSFNMSCKDAIDRGGVASAYYNLAKSFADKTPLTRSEFEQSLHAAAVMVKGRGLNHHNLRIWNAVNSYVNSNFANLEDDPNKLWLIHWRNDNIPQKRISKADILQTVVEQNISLLNKQIENAEPAKSQNLQTALSILTKISQMDLAKQIEVKDHTLLIEVASEVTKVAISPSELSNGKLEKISSDLGKRTFFQKLFDGLSDFITEIKQSLKSKNDHGHQSLPTSEAEQENLTKFKSYKSELQSKLAALTMHNPQQENTQAEEAEESCSINIKL